MSEDKSDQELDLSRFSMNEVEGEDTDRPAEKPKRAIGLILVVLVAVGVVAGVIAWRQREAGTYAAAGPEEKARADDFIADLRANAILQPQLQGADFISPTRLRIVIADTASPQQVQRVVEIATHDFARLRPSDPLSVHAFQAGRQVASGGYDPETGQVTVGPPVPITEPGSLDAGLQQSRPGGR